MKNSKIFYKLWQDARICQKILDALELEVNFAKINKHFREKTNFIIIDIEL